MDFYPIPNNLKSFRKQAGLRQVDVADKLGFKSAERISKWEHGDAMPNIVNLFKLAELYKRTVEELYGKFIEGMRENQRELNY